MKEFPLPTQMGFPGRGLATCVGTVQSDMKTVRDLLLLFLMMHVSNRNWCLSHLIELPFPSEKKPNSSCGDLFYLPCNESKK